MTESLLVPLPIEQFHLPAELDGSQGRNRGVGRIVQIAATNDLQAILCKQARYCPACVLPDDQSHPSAAFRAVWGALGGLMQDMGRRFVQYVNRTYRRSGGLWQGRYKSSHIQTERYLLACMRYVELNPVRAGIVKAPGEAAIIAGAASAPTPWAMKTNS